MESSTSTVTVEVQGAEDSSLGYYIPLITAIVFYLVTTILTLIEFSEAQDSNNNNNSSSVSQHSEEPTAGRRHYRHRPDHVGSGHHNSSPHAGGNQPSDNTKANGDSNRRLFYKYLLQSQICRLVLLPMSFFFSATYQITSIVSQTLPTLSFAISYAILVLFYAQVTITAAGAGATSTAATTGGNGAAAVAANGSGSGVASAAASSVRGVFDLVQMEKTVARWSYGIYALVVALNCVVPILESKSLQIILWSMLSTIYAVLFFSMAFYGSKIMAMLRGNMVDGLACRLVIMSTVCCIAFMTRAILFSWDVYCAIYKVGRFFPKLPDWWNGNYANNEFGRNVMGYLLIEWLPAAIVLALMHKKRREPTSSGRNAGAEETVAALEAGQYSPLVLDQHGHHPQENRKNVSIGTGVKRSYSANGGMAIPHARTQPYVQQHQNQRAVASSFASSMGGMISRSGSGGRSSEAASLLGGKSQSAIATPSYGAADD